MEDLLLLAGRPGGAAPVGVEVGHLPVGVLVDQEVLGLLSAKGRQQLPPANLTSLRTKDLQYLPSLSITF